MANKIYIGEQTENKKCISCNEYKTNFYLTGKTKSEAMNMFDEQIGPIDEQDYGFGVCSQCMINMLVKHNVEVE